MELPLEIKEKIIEYIYPKCSNCFKNEYIKINPMVDTIYKPCCNSYYCRLCSYRHKDCCHISVKGIWLNEVKRGILICKKCWYLYRNEK